MLYIANWILLWAFIGQVLQDGKQSSCNAAVTHAARHLLEQGLEPTSLDSGEYCLFQIACNEVGNSA